jgi:hypothetical protein
MISDLQWKKSKKIFKERERERENCIQKNTVFGCLIKIFLTRRVTDEDDGETNGLKDKLRGQMGVKTIALSEGCTIGPPAERE